VDEERNAGNMPKRSNSVDAACQLPLYDLMECKAKVSSTKASTLEKESENLLQAKHKAGR